MAAVLAGLVLVLATVAGAPFRHVAVRAQTIPPRAATPAVFESARAWECLRQMVAIGPRPAGSAGARQTRAYITRQLSSTGFVVSEQPFTAESPYGPVEMVNLIVSLPGPRADRVLIAGHYDTKLMPNQAFVGASDGASSAAVLIELARVLQSRPHEYTYEFVWFDGEEAFVDWKGLDHTYGSRYYVQAAAKAHALAGIKAMVLLDMIGDRDLQIRRDTNSTPWLNDVIWAAARRIGHAQQFLDLDTRIEDDHLPFLDAHVPAVDLIDLDYPTWHTPGDDLNHVSAESLQTVGDVVLAALPDIEKHLAR